MDNHYSYTELNIRNIKFGKNEEKVIGVVVVVDETRPHIEGLIQVMQDSTSRFETSRASSFTNNRTKKESIQYHYNYDDDNIFEQLFTSTEQQKMQHNTSGNTNTPPGMTTTNKVTPDETTLFVNRSQSRKVIINVTEEIKKKIPRETTYEAKLIEVTLCITTFLAYIIAEGFADLLEVPVYKHVIRLVGNSIAIKQKRRPTPFHYLEPLRLQIEEMLSNGLIRHSKPLWYKSFGKNDHRL